MPICRSDDAGGTSDPSVRLAAARRLLERLAPPLSERAERGGAAPHFAYRLRSGTIVLRLIADPPNVLLHFAHGALLPDPAGLLRGEGRRGRYLCLRDAAMLEEAGVHALIEAAMLHAG